MSEKRRLSLRELDFGEDQKDLNIELIRYSEQNSFESNTL